MSVKKIGHHNGLIIFLIFSFVLLLVLQDSPARTWISSNDDDAGYRVKKAGPLLTSAAGEDFKQLLEEAKKLYNDMDYEAAIQKLKAAQGAAKKAMEKADLYFYLSLAYYATLGGRDRSNLQDAIEKVFVYDYQREPDADLCPSGYIDIFNELKESFGAVKIDSQPRGADVYINRNLAGQTPLTVGAKAGTINILVKKGKVEKQDQLDVTAGEVMSSPIYELAGKKGKFPIVIVLGGVAVAGGAAAFLLKGGGGGNGGDKTGSIQVSSSPTGAKIYLDGVDTGKVTDATLTSVSAGSHTVKLTKDGYSDKEQSVTVTAGQTATVNLTLTKDTITITQPTAGTIWIKGSSVEIFWQVSAGSTAQSQPIMSAQSGAALKIQHWFNAQHLRAFRGLAGERQTKSNDFARVGRGKTLNRNESLREQQRIQEHSEALPSGDRRFVQGGAFLFSANPTASSKLGQQTGDTAKVLFISKMKIELYKGDSLAETIASETANDGSHTWQVSSSLASGSDYRVRVSCASDTTIWTESELFTIATGNYEYVTKWGNSGAGDGEFRLPHGVAVDSSGYVYVADYDNHRIQKFSSSGTLIGWSGLSDTGSTGWFTPPTGAEGRSGNGNGQFNRPKGIASGPAFIYVADNQNYRIQKLIDTTVTFVAHWGSKGTGDGQFNDPVGIAVRGSELWVTDYFNNRVQKFDIYGAFLDKWGSTGTGDSQFNYPTGIAVDNGGDVYVVDTNNSRIQKFTSNGTYITQWGGSGSANGKFNKPKGIAADKDGYIYVVDQGNARIQVFDSQGTFLTKWGTLGSGNGQFNQPWGIAVDGSRDVFVSDQGNNRIQKFRRVD